MTAAYLSLWPGREVPIPPAFLTLSQCLERTAAEAGMRVEEITGESRYRRTAYARQAFYALASAQTFADGRPRYSTPQIGRFIGRDHSTVVYGRRAHAERQERLG